MKLNPAEQKTVNKIMARVRAAKKKKAAQRRKNFGKVARSKK